MNRIGEISIFNLFLLFRLFSDEFVVETIANQADVNGHQAPSDVDMQMPISIHLDHLHNIYIAAGTLACAFVIVGLIVSIQLIYINNTSFIYHHVPFHFTFPIFKKKNVVFLHSFSSTTKSTEPIIHLQ